jgi:hypothetical protein
VGQPGNAQVADEDSQEQQGETKHADSKRRVTQMTIAEQFIASANRDEFLLVTPHQFENDDFILFGDGSAACPWENEATPDLAALEAGLDAALEFALRNLEGENDGGIVDLMQFLKDKGLR